MSIKSRLARLEADSGDEERRLLFEGLADFMHDACPDLTGEHLASQYPASIRTIDDMLLFFHANEGSANDANDEGKSS